MILLTVVRHIPGCRGYFAVSQHARVLFCRNFYWPGLAPVLDPSPLLPCPALPGGFLGTGGIPGGQEGIPEGTNTFPSSALSQGAPREHGSHRICTSSSALRIIPARLRSCVRSWLPSKLPSSRQEQPRSPIPAPSHSKHSSSFLTSLLPGDSSYCVRGLWLLLPAAATAPGASVQQVHAVGRGCPTSSWVGGSPSWGWRRLRGQWGGDGQGGQQSRATGSQAGPSRSPEGERGERLYPEGTSPALPSSRSSSTYVGIFHGAVPLHHLAFPVNEELWE